MTRRATFTQAELARAIRVAQAAGKVAVWTPSGIVFADSAETLLASPPAPAPDEGNTCDQVWGRAS
ncbi:MAG TPA: hypothetical protein PKD10_16135 [Paracoccaceae bacterium]|nr:hypothetical protein [Paracoccaceae bacterium]HMO73628.1 hypothetical protein [Paracoccaceae bacterium]